MAALRERSRGAQSGGNVSAVLASDSAVSLDNSRKRAGNRRFVVRALHNANRRHTVDGPAITVSPLHATLADSRPSCRDAILDAIERLRVRTGATEFARRDIVAEVRAAGASSERQTIYRCLRRMSGHEPGCAHHDLEDVGNDRLRVHR